MTGLSDHDGRNTHSILVRQHPHGQDLICYIGRDLLWSQVFRPGDGRDLGTVAADTLQGFQSRGWVRAEEPATSHGRKA